LRLPNRSAPLHAIFFIERSAVNRIVRIDDRREIVRRLLAYLIRPFVTADWWEKTLTSVEQMAREWRATGLVRQERGDC